MPGRPNRSTFLKGMTVAIGVGAVGVLFFKPDVNATSLSAAVQDTAITVEIPVQLVENPGRPNANRMTVMAPGAAASPGDSVVWLPPDGFEIFKIQFKHRQGIPATPNPFSDADSTFQNLGRRVLDDTPVGTTYYYAIFLKRIEGPPYPVDKSPDPPIDIVPRGGG